jgi:hypothetical protein
VTHYTRPDNLYFIATADSTMVKIGVAKDVADRFETLRGASPAPLKLEAVMAGGYELEKQVHFAFWLHHSHGEWFRSHPDIWDAIEHVRGNGALPDHLVPALGTKLPAFKWGPGARSKRAAQAVPA